MLKMGILAPDTDLRCDRKLRSIGAVYLTLPIFMRVTVITWNERWAHTRLHWSLILYIYAFLFNDIGIEVRFFVANSHGWRSVFPQKACRYTSYRACAVIIAITISKKKSIHSEARERWTATRGHCMKSCVQYISLYKVETCP